MAVLIYMNQNILLLRKRRHKPDLSGLVFVLVTLLCGFESEPPKTDLSLWGLHYKRHIRQASRVKKLWRCRGSNPGPFTCKANALPLSYIPFATTNGIPKFKTTNITYLTVATKFIDLITIGET